MAHVTSAHLYVSDTQVYQGLLSDYALASRGSGALLSQQCPSTQLATLSDAYTSLGITLPLLGRASATASLAHDGDTSSRRLKVLEDWNQWSSLYPNGLQPTLATCSPYDVLCFMQHWRETHHGLRRPTDPIDYLPEVAPSTLKSLRSHLSALCQALGRQGAWCPSHPERNPTDHHDVTAFLQGYARYCHEHTLYVASGAVPLTLDNHLKVITYLIHKAITSVTPISKAVYLRDLCLEAYLWETGQRGKEAGCLLVTDFTYGDTWCTPAFPSISASNLLPALPIMVESSRGTKTRKTKHPGTLVLQRVLGDNGNGILLHYLPSYAQAMNEAGSPLTGIMFKPLSPSQTQFEERPYTSGAYSARLKSHLTACSTWSGETAHSVRRGSTQALKASGASTSEIAEQRLWRRETTVDLYLHATRHKRRLVAQPLALGPSDPLLSSSEVD